MIVMVVQIDHWISRIWSHRRFNSPVELSRPVDGGSQFDISAPVDHRSS